GKMAPVGLDHAFFKYRRPGSHPIIKIRVRLCPGQGPRPVAVAHRAVSDNIVLIRGDRLALFPDRSPHRAVSMNGIVGPIPAGIGKIESSGKGAGDDLEAEFAGEQFGVTLDALKITRAAV